MAFKRRAHRPRSDDSKELGRNGGYEGSDEEVEESGKSGETAVSAEPKEMPLKQAVQPSAPPTKDAGAQGSGEAPRAPRGGVALKTKKTSKHAKKPPPASQQEDVAGDSGKASPARDPLPDDTAGAGHNKRAATLKRGPPPLQQGEERPEKRAARSGETVAASALQQLRKALPQATSPRSSSDIAQEDEHHDREMAEQEQSNATLPEDEHRAREEEERQEKKSTEQDARDKDRDMHKPRGAQTEKKAAVERSWSYDDELKILNALVAHARSHNGALLDSSHLLANLTFDKIDVTEDKLNDKIRKLKRRYCKFFLQGCPFDGRSRRLFKLSGILWGQVDEDERDEDEQVEPTSRDFSVLSELYPHLAKEVKAYAETHNSGDLIMAMFMTIGDEKARDLDAKCKKQHIEAFKLELSQASLTNELLSSLSSLTTMITGPSQATRKRRAEKLEEPLDEQYLRRNKRVSGKTGFKDKPNADEVLDPKPLSMAPPADSS